MNARLAVWMVAVTGVCSGWCAGPAFDRGAVLGAIEENDLVVDTDRHYTQGIKLYYFHADDDLPPGARALHEWIPEVGFDKVIGRFGYAIGQNIYTPADITNRSLLRGERPYAGWLYLGAVLQRRGWGFGRRLVQEDFGLDAGVIGPWALGKEAQVWVHETRGFDLPRGWKHQLKNEPGIRLKYARAVRLLQWQQESVGIDFTPRAGASLGNVESSLRAGAGVRVGFNLDDDFGYHNIDSPGTPSGGISKTNPVPWSAWVFAAAEGRAVLFNQTLDGSLFHTSHSVDREWLAGDAFLGFVLAWKHCEVGYVHTFRTPEFRGQTEHDSFGAVFGKWRF